MTKQTRILLLIVSCWASPLYAQHNYAALLHKPYEQRCRLLDSLFYPPSISDTPGLAAKINAVITLARQEGDEELRLEMEYRKLRFVNARLPGTHIEKQIQALVQQARAKGYQQLEIQTLSLLGLRQYVVYGNVWASIEHYQNAYHLMRQMPVARFPDKRDYLYIDLANIYYELEDYPNAKAVLLEADALPFYPIPVGVKIQGYINTANTLGLVYRALAQYDSAILYFEKAHTIALQQKDSIWLGITGGNIGVTYFLQKRYAEAVPLLEKDVWLSLRADDYGNAATSLLRLAEINLLQNNNPATHRQMAQVRDLIISSGWAPSFYPNLNDYYLLMARLHHTEGNAPVAYRYADSALQIQDTLFKQKKKVWLARAQQKTDNEHLKLEVEKLESQQRIQALVRNGLLCVLGLLVIITLLLVSRQQLLKKQRQFAEARRQLAQKELDDAQTLLSSFTANIREKNDLVERLTAEMVNLQTSLNKEAIDYRQTTLEQLRRNTILTDAEWETFKASFEKVYPGWFEGIGKKMPGLSAADLRFMALSKLQLNNREMASVLGISPGAIRMSRHRIRKKYNLSDEESLELLAGEV